jgi:hypothetical protein
MLDPKFISLDAPRRAKTRGIAAKSCKTLINWSNVIGGIGS